MSARPYFRCDSLCPEDRLLRLGRGNTFRYCIRRKSHAGLHRSKDREWGDEAKYSLQRRPENTQPITMEEA